MLNDFKRQARFPVFILLPALILGSGCMKRLPVARDPLLQKEVGKVLYVTTVDRREFKIKVISADSTNVRGLIQDVRYRGGKIDPSKVGTELNADYSEIIDIERGELNRRAVIYSLVGLTLATGVVWFVFGAL